MLSQNHFFAYNYSMLDRIDEKSSIHFYLKGKQYHLIKYFPFPNGNHEFYLNDVFYKVNSKNLLNTNKQRDIACHDRKNNDGYSS